MGYKNREKSIKILAGLLVLVLAFLLTGCGDKSIGVSDESTAVQNTVTDNNPHYTSLELKYATQFSIDEYENGIKHIHIEDGSDYVILPEGTDESALLSIGIDNAVIIKQEPKSIYMAASSAMDLVRELDGLDRIKCCSTKAEDYAIPEIRDAIESGSISYAGKYSAPDYEMLLATGTELAIESTMIYHTPKIKEQLERLGIPVLVERSSYEQHPLGRLEWIKLYGLLLGRYDEAVSFFDDECSRVDKLVGSLEVGNRKKVAFFSISPNGYVNVRKPQDYVSSMIDMSGGSYAFSTLTPEDDNALSTVKLNWEDFYRDAVDADIIIYNSTIYGGFETMDDLLSQNELFKDFKAVKEGNVWCTNMNLFQESSKIAVIIEDMYKVINNTDTGTVTFLYKPE
ncbi:MAG: ABC transporter substrate-binding protein [Lachnospiraceae bacterium]|nr:ABC transporter substrate-binding protein [Lachnospiraceae bacterium]